MIKTERLLIRTFEERDFLDTLNIFENDEVCKYLSHCPWSQLNALDNFQKRIEKNDLKKDGIIYLAVEFEKVVIGEIVLRFTNAHTHVDMNCSFNPEYTGKGLATEATKAILKFFLEDKDIHKIQTYFDSRNKNFLDLCERIGMRKEAHFVEHIWNKGEWVDTIYYGALKADI